MDRDERLRDPWRVEDRLAHKLRDAEYLLVLVLVLMLWTAGFVDLLTTLTPEGPILGMYSVRSFAALVLAAAGFAGWFALIVPRDGLPRVKRALAGVQANTRRAWLALAGLAAVFGTQLVWEPWEYYPLLSSAVLLLLMLVLAVLLAARPDPAARVLPWRRHAALLLALALGTEALLQIAAAAGWLPASIDNLSGLGVAYGRVYQRREGAINATTNRYGWPARPFHLAPGSERIVLQGDSYVQALQVAPREHVAAHLEARLSAVGDRPREVLPVGFPDYGPGVSTDPVLYPYVFEPFQPTEIVLILHAANDLQAGDGPGGHVAFFRRGDDGHVDVHPSDLELRHRQWHAVITGYEPVHPLRALKSQAFMLTWADRAWGPRRGAPPPRPRPPAHGDAADEAGAPFGRASFAFASTENPRAATAFDLLDAFLRRYHSTLATRGVRLRIAAVPHFPRAFYAEVSGSGWPTRWRSWDVLRPEREIGRMAAGLGVPFLGWGEYLRGRGLRVEEVQALFHRGGVGHLTARGHAVLADALAECFYVGEGPTAGCAAGR
jgi:hypothetical protein